MNWNRQDRNDKNGHEPNDEVHAALRLRGYLKLWCVTIIVTELLSAAFSYAVSVLDPDATFLPTIVFTCATSALFSRWLLMDARVACMTARERGFVTSVRNHPHPTIDVDRACPRRWLVVLYAELSAGANAKA
jgi:hypothetical protein